MMNAGFSQLGHLAAARELNRIRSRRLSGGVARPAASPHARKCPTFPRFAGVASYATALRDPLAQYAVRLSSRLAPVLLCVAVQLLGVPLAVSVSSVSAQNAASAADAQGPGGASRARFRGRAARREREVGRGGRAVRRAVGRARAKATARVRAAIAKLKSADEADVRAAIEELAQTGHPAAASALVQFVQRGQPDAVADRALEALGALASPMAIGVLQQFTRHRRPGARKRAYLALASIQDPDVPGLVAQGLRDCDGDVRGASAMAMAALPAKAWLDNLFQAFSQGVPEAAVAIGQLGDAAEVERFIRETDRQPLASILAGCERFLRREDIPDKAKLQIVARLGELSGNSVRRFLQSFLASSALRGKPALRRAVALTIRRMAVGGNGGMRSPAASEQQGAGPRRDP